MPVITSPATPDLATRIGNRPPAGHVLYCMTTGAVEPMLENAGIEPAQVGVR